eukprot:TRINITY_DN16680_c0_g1_i1.p1 TRINITY_DN16680_c0_g1~~TRINITY_DN16680_c0_g1_i1.p1  ORF type:complete len:206 (+),score=52.85 TRINITY_DN16680_c0_g1_i1:38-619(+)
MAAAPEGKLWFYNQTRAYGCFSNFSPHPVVIDGHRYQTTEHYFQAMKFLGSEADMLDVVKAASPSQAARIGRDRRRPLRKDWETVKEDIMKKALLAKFTQHKSCQDTLLETAGLFLVEHTENDRYWADGGDHSWDPSTPHSNLGKNRLGVLLTELREDFLSGRVPLDAADDDSQVAHIASSSSAPKKKRSRLQ